MTARKIEFLDAAAAELQAAAVWYAERDRSVARAFLAEARRITELVAKHPGIGAPWNEPRLVRLIRRMPMHRFPYLLVYLDGSPIRVVAVAHQRRSPESWRYRLAGLD